MVSKVAREVFGHASLLPGQETATTALLDGHDVPLVEDDVYGDLAYDGVRRAVDGVGRCSTRARNARSGAIRGSVRSNRRVRAESPGLHEDLVVHRRGFDHLEDCASPGYWRFDLAKGPAVFAHGARVEFASGRILLACYHPSQQNTFTGRLTPAMMDEVLSRAISAR